MTDLTGRPGQPGLFRRNATRLVALALILGLFGFARLPTLPAAQRQALAGRFAFARTPLATPAGLRLDRTVREVHPGLKDIASWVSSVGAAVALNDLDGDGLPNDLCSVDTRLDKVLVQPAPGTGARYPLFVLDPSPLAYDARTTAPMGCLPGDFNEDGRMDLLVYYWGRPPIVFLRRDDAGPLSAASFRPLAVAPGNQIWNTNALTSADVDGDGHLDLIVGNYFPDGMRVLDAKATDGAHMHRSMSRSENGGKKHLLLWKGGTSGHEPTVEFVDVENAFDPQTTWSWTLAVGAADLDGDLLPEIYFGNDFGNDRLLHNLSTPGHPRFAVLEGRRTFTTPTSKVLGHDSFKGMGVDFADVNGDGIPDLYVSNIAQNYALEESHFVWVSTGDLKSMRRGVAPYADQGETLGLSRSGWGWDARFVDFDNDGVPEAIQAVGFMRGEKNRWPELHELAMGNDNNMNHPAAWPHFWPGDDLSGHLHDPFFVRARDGRYYDLAAEMGFDDAHVSRGLAIADVDGDGRLDFAVANQWETSWFFHNASPHAGTWLELVPRLPALEGRSRPAVGAEVAVTLPDGRRRVAQVDGGSGHSGKRAPEVHFGLGSLNPATPLRVDVRWRDGQGRPRATTLRLTPGRHTLVLGAPAPPQLPQTAAGKDLVKPAAATAATGKAG
ncbi:MAG: CRTAC1 family protein [Acidobacteria bacterium]|nr:CRTAC1 family protein [Acidobacteriota bacterium]